MERYTVTLGALTTAGGKVISASSKSSINGVPIALENDAIFCLPANHAAEYYALGRAFRNSVMASRSLWQMISAFVLAFLRHAWSQIKLFAAKFWTGKVSGIAKNRLPSP